MDDLTAVTTEETTGPGSVLDFWFGELQPTDWFSGAEALDRMIAERFGSLLQRAAQCELFQWRNSAGGRLAEIILLDQFSRNVYRNKPKAFAQDSLALALAQEAVAHGFDQQLPLARRSFLYMPYMHSESPQIHEVAVELFSAPGMESSYDYELKHKAIIDRFGRYPHRNIVLDRKSTAEELAFLSEPGSSF